MGGFNHIIAAVAEHLKFAMAVFIPNLLQALLPPAFQNLTGALLLRLLEEEAAVNFNSDDRLSTVDRGVGVVSNSTLPASDSAASPDTTNTINIGPPNWLDLPDHIMILIADKLKKHGDLIRFGAVCPTWKPISTELTRVRLPRLPLLMLATDLNPDHQTRSFYSLTHKTVSNSKVPVPHNRFCFGSSHGWLVTVTPDFQVSLLNPFLSKEIHLPPLTAFERTVRRTARGNYYRAGHDNIEDYDQNYLEKAVLSADPESDPDYIVMAIYDGCCLLAFFKPGDRTWTTVDSELAFMCDIIYCRDRFYAVNNDGVVFAIDLSHAEPRVLKVALAPPTVRASKRYLVESQGDLLQIVRQTNYERGEDRHNYINGGFIVFKLDPIENQWVELHNLEGQILFLGDNSSLCLQASDFPECKPNSIYFTDDNYNAYSYSQQFGIGPHDMGIFSFEDRSVKPHYPTDSNMIVPAPIWVEPSH